jgi:hypothetical protein
MGKGMLDGQRYRESYTTRFYEEELERDETGHGSREPNG